MDRFEYVYLFTYIHMIYVYDTMCIYICMYTCLCIYIYVCVLCMYMYICIYLKLHIMILAFTHQVRERPDRKKHIPSSAHFFPNAYLNGFFGYHVYKCSYNWLPHVDFYVDFNQL